MNYKIEIQKHAPARRNGGREFNRTITNIRRIKMSKKQDETVTMRNCPFCDYNDVYVVESDQQGFYIGVCPACYSQGPRRSSIPEAAMAWNGNGGN